MTDLTRIIMALGVTSLATGMPRLGVPPAHAQAKIWTSETPANDYETPQEKRTRRPISILAVRNGTFSGKAVIEAAGPIKAPRATIGALSGPAGTIPAANVQVRYAVEYDFESWLTPVGPDTLLETPPAEFKTSRRGNSILPVWVTVAVPKDANPGEYSGELTLEAEGFIPAKMPVSLEVVGWALPDPQGYRTWCDIVQSPDTLAVEYGVPLWSDRHWELIARSFRLLSGTGGRSVYIPLICRANIGNEESMVRWIRKPGGGYDYDFSVMEKYLDTAEQNLGTPKAVYFWVWDICMSQKSLTRGLWGGGNPTREGREGLLNKGARVTGYDPGTGKTDVITLPRYRDSEGKAAWQPLWAELRTRMAKRGLEGRMLIGMISDLEPDKEDVAALQDITGGVPWAAQRHPSGLFGKQIRGNKLVAGIADLASNAHVYQIGFQVNPAKGRLYGWRAPSLDTHYYRGRELLINAIDVRLHPEFAITGGQRGVGRIPGEFWDAVRDRQGKRGAKVFGRYPENQWRNLDICSWFLAPGPDGAVMTTRLEQLREGIQECEARIFLEDALLDAGKKAKLGDDLARRCQEMLDARQLALWKTVWMDDADIASVGFFSGSRNPEEAIWHALAKGGKALPGYWDGAARKMRGDNQFQGRQWWLQDWQERNRQLFTLCAEAAAKLQ